MIKKVAGEIWKQIQFSGYKTLKKKYAVSNYGQAASFTDDINEDGKLLSGSLTSGYRTLNFHVAEGSCTVYFHREIARAFCPKKSPKQKLVVHKNHIKTDNHYKNLLWTTTAEASAHQQGSPDKIAYKLRQAVRTKGLKLTAVKVKLIKNAISNPNRKLTLKQLSEKHGVSEMTIYRIRSGENWSQVK